MQLRFYQGRKQGSSVYQVNQVTGSGRHQQQYRVNSDVFMTRHHEFSYHVPVLIAKQALTSAIE